MSFSAFSAHTDPLFKSLRLLKFQDINVLMTGVFMYKALNNLMPSIFRDFFIFASYLHSYSTRKSDSLYISKYRITLFKFSIQVNGPTVWNNIPPSVKDVPSLYLFKRKLKKHLTD